MSKKVISIANYRKRKQERTQSKEDILQEFDESMQSPEVPLAIQPQDGPTFLPPMSKKAKVPTHPAIDLTTEPDAAVEQPLPVAPQTQLPPRPPTTSNSSSSVPGQMSDTQYWRGFLHHARHELDSPISSPSNSTRGSRDNSDLIRVPIKSQRERLAHQQSSSRDLQTGAPLKSKFNQSQNSRTERSFAPSMGSSLPSVDSKPLPAPVQVAPTTFNKQTNIGNYCSDTKKLPFCSMKPPGSLLAEIYSSSPTTPNSDLTRGRIVRDGTTNGKRGSDRQRILLGDKKPEAVVVIDVDEGKQTQDSSRHHAKPSEPPQKSRETPPGHSERVTDGKSEGGASFEHRNQSLGEQRKTDSSSSSPLKEPIPTLEDLKARTPRSNSPLKLKKSQDPLRRSYKEEDGTGTESVSGLSTVAVCTRRSIGEATGSTDDEANDVQRHTMASSSAESDDSVLYMETTSCHFTPSPKERSKRDVVAPVTKEVWPSSSVTPPTDILTRIEPTQQRVTTKPQDKTSSNFQRKFVPRKDHSLENKDCNLEDCLSHIPPKQHHNCFAKGQSSSMASRSATPHLSKNTGIVDSGCKTKPRISEESLNKTPTLSKGAFSFFAEEKPAASGRAESKAAKKSSQAIKNTEVIFQAEEGLSKQYNMRNRSSRPVRSSEIEDNSSSEGDDFESAPLRKKTITSGKNTSKFYGGIHVGGNPILSNVLKVAEDNVKRGMMKFNKAKGAPRSRGLQQTARGTEGYKNTRDVLKSHNAKSLGVGRIPRRWQSALTAADDDEMTLDLSMVQVGRLVSDAAFNLEIKSKELHFQFECNGKVHRQIIELKQLTSWKMNLGDDPRFIAIEVDWFITNRLKSSLVDKFHLNSNFFKQGGQDPSQRYIIFRLGDAVSPQNVSNINEVLDGLNTFALNCCDVSRDMSLEAATEFLESVKPTEPAKSTVPLMSNKDIAGLSLADRGTGEDVATITGQSGRASRKQLVPVRRSTRQKRPPRDMYPTSSLLDSENDSQEDQVTRRPRTPVKLLTYKPQGSKVMLDIMSTDLECLDPGEYLNDKIIDFYLNYLLYEKLSEEFRSRVHIFSTFFYTRLSNTSMDDKASNCSTPEKLHSRVKTWTRRVDLFLKDYIILPVCDKAHWYVIIVCHPGRFDPNKVKPPAPRRQKQRSKSSRKSMRLHKRHRPKDRTPTPSDVVDQEEAGPSEQHGDILKDESLENQETTATALVDMEGNIFDLPAVAEVGSGITMSSENLHQTPIVLDATGDSDRLKVELMEYRESPFSQLALAEVIPETPPVSSQESEGDKERYGDGSITLSHTCVTLAPGTLDSSAAAAICNDGDVTSIAGSMCNEDTILYETEQQTTIESNSELVAGSTDMTISYPETGQVESIPSTGRDDDQEEEESMQYEGYGSGGEDNGDREEGAVGVENVCEIKVEEEDLEPQKRSCIQILDSLGIRRITTAKRIRNYLTMEWKSKKEDELSFEYLPLQYPSIPLQDNSSDCGIFVLQYIESLLDTIQKGDPPPTQAEEWASYEKTRAKRKELQKLITDLQEKEKLAS